MAKKGWGLNPRLGFYMGPRQDTRPYLPELIAAFCRQESYRDFELVNLVFQTNFKRLYDSEDGFARWNLLLPKIYALNDLMPTHRQVLKRPGSDVIGLNCTSEEFRATVIPAIKAALGPELVQLIKG